MARQKLVTTTLADLKAILDEHGDRPEIVHGVAVAARRVWAIDATGHTDRSRKVEFLLGLLNDVFYDLSRRDGGYHEKVLFDDIYVEIVGQLLGDLKDRLYDMVDGNAVPLRGLIAILGQHEPLDGMRGKVRQFLGEVANRCSTAKSQGYEDLPALDALASDDYGWCALAWAMLRYQMISELEMLVDRHVYEIMPVLSKAVLEQSKLNQPWLNQPCLESLVRRGWSDTDNVARAFKLVGEDARVLKLLLNLAQKHLDECGEPYPVHKLYYS